MNIPGHNCRYCGDSPKSGKRVKVMRIYKKRDKATILDMVRNAVFEAKLANKRSVTKEALSVKLQLRESEVEQALHILNLQGLVSQAYHCPPHDSTRDSMGWGCDSSWCGDTYSIRS